MNERNRQVQSYFHRSAADFDRLYHETGRAAALFNRLFRAALYKRSEVAVEEILASQAGSVLDVGCGSGVHAVMLAEHGVDRIVGLDYAENMLSIARSKLPEQFKERVEYRAGDFMSWEPPPGERYDAVMALGVFDYLDEPRPFLEKMLALADRKVLFSVPLSGNLRAVVRGLRYRARGCPLYFYDRDRLGELLNFPGTSHRSREIGSSGRLCVVEKA